MNEHQRQEGQSVVIIALGLVALLAFMALAVDGGNVYAQRRQVQNAVDAAASAGSERLVRPNPSDSSRATNKQVLDVVKKYLRDNGVDPDATTANLSVRYVTRDTSNSTHIDSAEITSYGSNLAAPLKIPAVTGDPVVGVHVNVDKEFTSFFASVIGIHTLSVGALGRSFGAPILTNPTPGPPTTGACCADELFPIVINQDMFQDLDGDGNLDVRFEEGAPTDQFTIWLRDSGPPNFRFVHWKGQSANSSTLQSNMNTVANSGTWYVEEWLSVSTATMGQVVSTFQNKQGQTFTVPVYDSARNSDSEYRIVGFARMELVKVCNPSGSGCVANATSPHIQVKFEQWASSRCQGSCSFFGVRTNKPGEPQEMERSLIGVVKIFKQTPLQIPLTQVPVDVMHVLDISGSMRYCIGTTTDCSNSNSNQKLKLAKTALITFNSIVSPTLGDKVGLATFPRDQGTSRYSMPCGGNYSTFMFGQNRHELTSSNIGAAVSPYNPSGSVNHVINNLNANSGTPIAGGLLVGRQMVIDPSFHVPGHQPVIILASDGIANVRTNGRWTGFTGSTYSDPPCNKEAVQDAIAEANQAKQDLNGDGRSDVIIFSIAIGTDFNAYALEAIASEPKNSHFYTVSDAAAMQDIYAQIADRLGTADCTTTPSEDFAPNAVVRVRNTTTGETMQTTTTSTGFFAFTDISPGTYEFTFASVTISGFTYDIFTDGVGGPILNNNPTIEVGEAPTTYPINLALGTDDFLNSCN
ncbi:MAG: VWA domain-containing protein [Anaerolineae bacterium]|nr:VWA domain-containing protein [Anaerolineae bacterium]